MDEQIEERIQYETNVDDLDPRLWPDVIKKLLAVGALDAWLVPIIMKKGRPAHTLCVLCDVEAAAAVRTAMFQETTTIGIREVPVRRYVLPRREDGIVINGHEIGVKSAYHDGSLVNRSVEWEDVATAAEALGLSAKQVLRSATAAAEALGDGEATAE